MEQTHTGQRALWIVTAPTAVSILADVLFQATPERFALQVLGGLRGDEVLGWFEHEDEARAVAIDAIGAARL